MGKKTEYKFNFSVDASIIENTIQLWLVANGFSKYEKDGLNCYRQGDALVQGYKFFEYYINGNELSILGYIGSIKHPKSLDNKFVGVLAIAPYRKLISNLLEELKRVNENGRSSEISKTKDESTQSQDNNLNSQNNTQDDMQSAINKFKDQNNKTWGNWTIFAFVMSILSLIMSIFGYMFGVIIIILVYYVAINGLKTTKKGLAIASIAITSVSLFIIFLEIVYTVLTI